MPKTLVTINDLNVPHGMRIQAANPQDGINYAASAIACGYHALVTVSDPTFSVVLERHCGPGIPEEEVEFADWESLFEAFPELPEHVLRSGGYITLNESPDGEVAYVAYERR